MVGGVGTVGGWGGDSGWGQIVGVLDCTSHSQHSTTTTTTTQYQPARFVRRMRQRLRFSAFVNGSATTAGAESADDAEPSGEYESPELAPAIIAAAAVANAARSPS